MNSDLKKVIDMIILSLNGIAIGMLIAYFIADRDVIATIGNCLVIIVLTTNLLNR